MKHNKTFFALLAITALGFGACAADGFDDSVGSQELALDNQDFGQEQVRSYRSAKVVMSAEYERELMESGAIDPVTKGAIAHAGETIVYMNRVGGTFSPGQNDSSNNKTSLTNQTVNFPPANMSEAQWQEVMTCMRGQFSQFNVRVTDIDPGATPHFESVVAGSPQLLGMANGVGGVSPFTGNCSMIPKSIVFTFTEVLPNNPQIICEVAAQEVAHSFGLDHEFLCEDPMTYLNGCGAKSFQDVAAPCGEGSARACASPGQYDCGYAQQNSVQLMTQRLGLNEGNDPVTTAQISAPVDGSSVNQGFQVSVSAEAAATMELKIDGISVSTLNSAPFVFSTPSDLEAGTHILEITANGDSGTVTDSIAVTLIAGGGGGNGGGGNGNGGGNGGGDGNGGFQDADVTGGCSTGGSQGSGMMLLLALGLLALRRRND